MKAGPRPFPVEGCSVRAETQMAMWMHLWHLDTGVGKPPPPTVPSVQNSGAGAGPERSAPAHGAMQEGVGAEEMVAGSGGVKGSYLTGVQHLWTPPLIW